MTWLRRLLGARAERGTTDDELAVLGLILHGDDPRLRLIYEQMGRAPEIEREYTDSGFRVSPTSTFDDLTFPLEIDRLESAWLAAADVSSGRDLEFRVVLGRHGFLRGLEGRTVDGGQWPREWRLGRVDPDAQAEGLLELPPAAEASAFQVRARDQLSAWLGIPVSSRIELVPPASSGALAQRETEIGGRFPSDVLRFLTITDGMSARGIHIHGHRDMRPIENRQIPALLVAWDADDRDEFLVVVSLDATDNTVYRIDVHETDLRPRPLVDQFSEYVKECARV